MNTVQTNVRVPPDDKPVMRAIAARLRADTRFHERLKALLAEEASPALEARITRLEEQVRGLLGDAGEGRGSRGPDPSCGTPATGNAEAGVSGPTNRFNAD
jgi:hypothetical protein